MGTIEKVARRQAASGVWPAFGSSPLTESLEQASVYGDYKQQKQKK